MADLIDGKKLLDKCESWNGYGWQHSMCREKDIRNAPAIDAEPVRHGRWVKPVPGDGEPYCSECKAKQLYLPYVGYFHSKYCPYCGAKMEAI